MLAGYRRGLEDGRMPRDRQAGLKPPTLDELRIEHPKTASDDPENMARKRPWLDSVPVTKP